jgi:hypothetical protein
MVLAKKKTCEDEAHTVDWPDPKSTLPDPDTDHLPTTAAVHGSHYSREAVST